MARNGVFSRRRRVDEDLSFSPLESHEVHVLAVDDSIVDRKVIEKLLKITSCKVTAVDSGIRALQFLGLDEEKGSDGLNELKVDLIITDYCMPGMTGYELLKKIKGSSTFREIPVVIMSSENVLARIDRCLEEGAEDFIVKPVKLSDVKRLKDYMFGEDKHVRGAYNKRKLQDTSDEIPMLPSKTPSPSPPPAISVSPPASPKSALMLDSDDSSPPSSPVVRILVEDSSPPSSPVARILVEDLSPPSSPVARILVEDSSPSPPPSLESPTRRLRMSNISS